MSYLKLNYNRVVRCRVGVGEPVFLSIPFKLRSNTAQLLIRSLIRQSLNIENCRYGISVLRTSCDPYLLSVSLCLGLFKSFLQIQMAQTIHRPYISKGQSHENSCRVEVLFHDPLFSRDEASVWNQSPIFVGDSVGSRKPSFL